MVHALLVRVRTSVRYYVHSSYVRKTTKARLPVMNTCVQHSFGTLPPGVLFQTLPLSSRALEGLGTRLVLECMRYYTPQLISKQ